VCDGNLRILEIHNQNRNILDAGSTTGILRQSWRVDWKAELGRKAANGKLLEHNRECVSRSFGSRLERHSYEQNC